MQQSWARISNPLANVGQIRYPNLCPVVQIHPLLKLKQLKTKQFRNTSYTWDTYVLKKSYIYIGLIKLVQVLSVRKSAQSSLFNSVYSVLCN